MYDRLVAAIKEEWDLPEEAIVAFVVKDNEPSVYCDEEFSAIKGWVVDE